MMNPWLNIPASDYTNHMNEVGQAQLLSRLTKKYLKLFKPENFVLVGCATGNGLEHIDNSITSKVYAIDINVSYLRKCESHYKKKIPGLEILQLDIQNDSLNFSNIDLYFIGLVLEYVDPIKTLDNIFRTLNENGKIVIILQKTKQSSVVSKSKYDSLKKLHEVFNEVDEREIDGFMIQKGMNLMEKTEIPLHDQKSFIQLIYRK